MSTAGSTGGVQSTGPASTGSASTGMASTGSASYPGSTASSTGAQSMGWGDDWRTRMAGGDEKGVKQLERYESPEQVWKKARELETRMSSGELRSTLRKDATPEEISRWRTDNGIPAKPEEYKINVAAGKQVPKEDDAFLKGFLASAHAANFTQSQVDSAVAAFYGEADRQATAITEAERAAELATEDKLRQEWGPDYRVNKTMAEGLLARAPEGFRDRFLNGYLADSTKIKASPEAWKWLVQLEREINPAATVVPGAQGDVGKTIEAEIIDLKKLMANRQSEYWKGPKADGMQARYRDLIEAQEKLKARA